MYESYDVPQVYLFNDKPTITSASRRSNDLLTRISYIHRVSKKLHIVLCEIFSRTVDRLQKFQRL